jgi:hypothetical protein
MGYQHNGKIAWVGVLPEFEEALRDALSKKKFAFAPYLTLANVFVGTPPLNLWSVRTRVPILVLFFFRRI